MRKSNEPFTRTLYRIDRVYRVPTSMVNILKVGDMVKRTGDKEVVTLDGRMLAVGGAYTQFSHWTEDPS